jgi:hypothetical protein
MHKSKAKEEAKKIIDTLGDEASWDEIINKLNARKSLDDSFVADDADSEEHEEDNDLTDKTGFVSYH